MALTVLINLSWYVPNDGSWVLKGSTEVPGCLGSGTALSVVFLLQCGVTDLLVWSFLIM